MCDTIPHSEPCQAPARRYQFSLAGLFALMTVCAVAAALWPWREFTSTGNLIFAAWSLATMAYALLVKWAWQWVKNLPLSERRRSYRESLLGCALPLLNWAYIVLATAVAAATNGELLWGNFVNVLILMPALVLAVYSFVAMLAVISSLLASTVVYHDWYFAVVQALALCQLLPPWFVWLAHRTMHVSMW